MGIQDKVFDVAAALEDKPEEEDFGDIVEYMWKLEEEVEQLRKEAQQVDKMFDFIGQKLSGKLRL